MEEAFNQNNQIPPQPFMRVERITLRSHVSILPGILFIFAIAVLAGFLIYARATQMWPFGSTSMETKNEQNDAVACIQVITPARNPATGETRDFPTPCHVPAGWEVLDEESVTVWKTYRNEEYGFEVQYPEAYSTQANESEPSDIVVLSADEPSISNISNIVIRRLNATPSSFKDALLQDTIFDGSGLHPNSFEQFESRRLGSNEFYFIRTGLFEGTLGYNYYLVTESDIFAFNLIFQGADWTNPNFDSENFHLHVEARAILSTFKFIEPQ